MKHMKHIKPRVWRFIRAMIMVFGVVGSSIAVAETLTAADVLQKKLHAMHTMQATFKQVIYNGTRVATTSSGQMSLVRPGRFRWETRDPMHQIIVANGQSIWIYDVDLEQVTVKKQANVLDSTVGLFLSRDDTYGLSHYRVSMKQTSQHQSDFELQAISSRRDFNYMKLRFIKDNVLSEMELQDALGQRTVWLFDHIKLNTTIPLTTFHFTPPKQVDVLDERDASN